MMNFKYMPVMVAQKFEGALVRYYEHGIAPGSFLQSVLENDLSEAAQCADPESEHMMAPLGKWMQWEMPREAWGSPQRVALWMAERHRAPISASSTSRDRQPEISHTSGDSE